MLFDDINNFSECFLDKSVLSKTLPLHGALLISQFSVNGPVSENVNNSDSQHFGM